MLTRQQARQCCSLNRFVSRFQCCSLWFSTETFTKYLILKGRPVRPGLRDTQARNLEEDAHILRTQLREDGDLSMSLIRR